MDLQNMTFAPEHILFFVMGFGVAIKSVKTMKHLCVRGLASEQSIALGIFIVSILQMIAATNYLFFIEHMFVEYTLLHKVFMLASGVFINLMNFLVLENFSKYRSVRRTRPKKQ